MCSDCNDYFFRSDFVKRRTYWDDAQEESDQYFKPMMDAMDRNE